MNLLYFVRTKTIGFDKLLSKRAQTGFGEREAQNLKLVLCSASAQRWIRPLHVT